MARGIPTRSSDVIAAERIAIESPGDPWYEEHQSRYSWARQFVNGKIVLDAACGTGHGLGTIRGGGADWILGIDRSSKIRVDGVSVKSIQVCQADLSSIPVKDDSFDVVTSFETIEHLASPEAFLDEVARVLRPRGSLLMSTPNGALTLRKGRHKPRNPYHVREFRPDELAEMVSQRFETVTLFGQVVSPAFGVCPFWDARSKIVRAMDLDLRGSVWSVLARLPRVTAEAWIRRILGQPMYPTSGDFEFNEEGVMKAHALAVKADLPKK